MVRYRVTRGSGSNPVVKRLVRQHNIPPKVNCLGQAVQPRKMPNICWKAVGFNVSCLLSRGRLDCSSGSSTLILSMKSVVGVGAESSSSEEPHKSMVPYRVANAFRPRSRDRHVAFSDLSFSQRRDCSFQVQTY